MIEALKDYPVIITETVRWGDMDAFQHVNNTVFFQYFESARMAFFEQVKFFRTGNPEGDVGPILSETSCRFRRPLSPPDSLQVGAKMSEMKDDRFTMQYLIWSEKLNAVAAEGTGTIVAYDYAFHRKAKLPATVRAAILALHTK